MPSLVRWHKELGPEVLSIITVFSYTAAAPDKAKSFIRKNKVTFPLLADGNGNQTRHGVLTYPSAFFLDSQGKVLWQGILPRDRSDPGSNRQWLDDLLRRAGVEPPPPPIHWLEFEKGLDESQWTWGNRLLLVESNGCTQSQRIHKLLEEDEEIKKLVDGFIRVKIDGRSQLEIAKKYGAAWPGDLVIIDPDDKVLFRYWDDFKDVAALKRALRVHTDD